MRRPGAISRVIPCTTSAPFSASFRRGIKHYIERCIERYFERDSTVVGSCSLRVISDDWFNIPKVPIWTFRVIVHDSSDFFAWCSCFDRRFGLFGCYSVRYRRGLERHRSAASSAVTDASLARFDVDADAISSANPSAFRAQFRAPLVCYFEYVAGSSQPSSVLTSIRPVVSLQFIE